MRWYALLPLAALLSLAHALTRTELQGINLYYRDHRQVCGSNHFVVVTEDGTNYTLRSSGIPSHSAVRTSPYRAARQMLTYNFPREPEVLEYPLCIPTGVPIGIARDGVPFYSALTKDWNNAVEGGCAMQYDRCRADTDRYNQYHYRQQPDTTEPCLNLPERNQDTVFLGVALDGFPIYSDRRRNESLLDECGGRFMDVQNRRDYRYFVGDSYPYTIGCFRGKVNNISTLAHCKGSDGKYGKLCTCVNFGLPGFAAGYNWLAREDVTTGRCERRPTASSERSRELICDRNAIPAPEFTEEDRPSDTCVDFRSLYSLLTFWGLKGGLADWTMLKNYGMEEKPLYKEENVYVRHYKSLRWLLDDLDVLDWPYLEKRMEMEKNKSKGAKPLCPKEQVELRETLAQVWVLTYLRQSFDLPRNATNYERFTADRMFRRLMWVLRSLKSADLSPYIMRSREGDDPWGIWRAPRGEGDRGGEGEGYSDRDAMAGLVAQLGTLQTLGNMRGDRMGGMMSMMRREGDREGGDREESDRERMEYNIMQILRMLRQMSGRGRGGEGEGEGGYGEGMRGKGEGMRGRGEGEGMRGRGEGEGMRGRGEGEGMRGRGEGEGMRGRGEGEGMRGRGEGEGMRGRGEGEGMRGRGEGEGMRGRGKGWGMRGRGEGEGMRGRGEGEGMRGRGEGEGMRGKGEGGRCEGKGEGYRGGEGEGMWGKGNGEREGMWGKGNGERGGKGKGYGRMGGEGEGSMRGKGYGGRGEGEGYGGGDRDAPWGSKGRGGRMGGYGEDRDGEGRYGEGRYGEGRRGEGRYGKGEGMRGYGGGEGEGRGRMGEGEGWGRMGEGEGCRRGGEGEGGRRMGEGEGYGMRRDEDDLMDLLERFKNLRGYNRMRMIGGLQALFERERSEDGEGDGDRRGKGRG